MARAEQIRLRDTAESPYFFRNVIRNPKPIKIITWTSWKTTKRYLLIIVLTICIFVFTWINILDLFVTLNDTILASLGVDWVISIELRKLNVDRNIFWFYLTKRRNSVIITICNIENATIWLLVFILNNREKNHFLFTKTKTSAYDLIVVKSKAKGKVTMRGFLKLFLQSASALLIGGKRQLLRIKNHWAKTWDYSQSCDKSKQESDIKITKPLHLNIFDAVFQCEHPAST